MKEYFPEKKSHQKIVPPQESIEIDIELNQLGPITLSSHIQNDDELYASPVHIKLELLDTDANKIIATKEESEKITAQLVHQPVADSMKLPSQWKARLTNLGKNSEHIYFEVLFPGNFPIESIMIPAQSIAHEFQTSLCETKIRITSGENASFLVFTEDLEVNDMFFTVPDFEYTIEKIWPIPDLHIFEYTNSINSADIAFSLNPSSLQFKNGFFRFSVRFEEIGSEILGTYHCQLNDMLLTIDLGLKLLNQNISYDKDNIRINFSYDLNILGLDPKLKDYILTPILEYTDTIKKIIENRLRAIFTSNEMVLAFARIMDRLIEDHIDTKPFILSVNSEGDHLLIHYFRDH